MEPNKSTVDGELCQVGCTRVQYFTSPAIPVLPGASLEPRRGRPARSGAEHQQATASPVNGSASERIEFRHGLPESPRRVGRVYATAIDMDIEALRVNFGDPYNNAYLEIRRVLQRHGFSWHQGSVYFGGEVVTAVTCVLAAQDLARSLPWFAASVRDIRMLRIEELNDLMPAVQQVSGQE